jgi:hypothetical protein
VNLFEITLITHPGVGNQAVEALHRAGIQTANFHRARGSSIGESVQHEQDVVSVIVRGDVADEIFEFLFTTFGNRETQPGFLYMAKLGKATEYRLPEI